MLGKSGRRNHVTAWLEWKNTSIKHRRRRSLYIHVTRSDLVRTNNKYISYDSVFGDSFFVSRVFVYVEYPVSDTYAFSRPKRIPKKKKEKKDADALKSEPQ